MSNKRFRIYQEGRFWFLVDRLYLATYTFEKWDAAINYADLRSFC